MMTSKEEDQNDEDDEADQAEDDESDDEVGALEKNDLGLDDGEKVFAEHFQAAGSLPFGGAVQIQCGFTLADPAKVGGAIAPSYKALVMPRTVNHFHSRCRPSDHELRFSLRSILRPIVKQAHVASDLCSDNLEKGHTYFRNRISDSSPPWVAARSIKVIVRSWA
ncbi:hypothetical protein LshimejAT787_0803270 [Lyophyllum shimeji]|uniref:Uncharacterized protein n=1 Tax=Lyophyllum shimeji TaxID=47721 RepID=A0A9P3PSE5_LYOSH|nr:hypothetical protein LshimejAT787_0803270 [Lyophyllum shimeji]